MSATAVVIGSGFAGLSVASFLARSGYDVTILEKNATPGGRARTFSENGFIFDMGPSWYWMPDVFERYFQQFGYSVADLYELKRLDPSYAVHYEANDTLEIPTQREALFRLFEKLEPGSSPNLDKFLKDAAYKYDVGMSKLVNLPGRSLMELFDADLLKGLKHLSIFNTMSSHVRKHFKNERLIRLLEFPVLFLGATAQNTPALYSLMNHADLSLGTWYPMGGMGRVIDAMVRVAKDQGVHLLCGQEVKKIEVQNGRAVAVLTANNRFVADVVVGSADYHHVEQELLEPEYRRYSKRYWNSRSLAPSAIMFYLGLDRKVPELHHHNLFFHADPDLHANEIYKDPKWPTDPQFYVNVTSRTDASVAPEGCENMVVLIPVAPGLDDTEQIRAYYLDLVLTKMEDVFDKRLKEHVIFQRSYAHRDFIADHHAFKGNAYGLANTLGQTANLKPRIDSRKVKNLYYTGQLTVPGPGVPPALISGEMVAKEIVKDRAAIVRSGLNKPL